MSRIFQNLNGVVDDVELQFDDAGNATVSRFSKWKYFEKFKYSTRSMRSSSSSTRSMLSPVGITSAC